MTMENKSDSYRCMISLAGVPLLLESRFRFDAFEPFRTEEEPVGVIPVGEETASRWKQFAAEPVRRDPREEEFLRLLGEVGTILVQHDRCVFHGTAFIRGGRAWLLTAPSGTGKTTQYVLWKHLYPDEVMILNGDKPILSFEEDGTVTVHPSPWRGKENMGAMHSAPLGGIILLMQAEKNRVYRLPPSAAAMPLYRQFLLYLDSPETVDRLCALEDRLLSACPVWALENAGDEASVRLMHDTITEWEQT